MKVRPRMSTSTKACLPGVHLDTELPTVEELLDVDREYRAGVAADTLKRIAPRRMNPRREAWLPVLHTARGPRHYTALFSNTPHAHAAGMTHDWVVLYFGHGGSREERQCTVLTSQFGPLRGRRIVCGRERECLELVRRRAWEEAVRGVAAAAPVARTPDWERLTRLGRLR